MPISGLIVTLEQDPARRLDGLQRLRSNPALELGVQEGRRLAVVSETASRAEDLRLWESLQDCTGVEHVDVVYVHFQEEGRPS
jgi:nitrate reductase NapAB chaperone NapD